MTPAYLCFCFLYSLSGLLGCILGIFFRVHHAGIVVIVHGHLACKCAFPEKILQRLLEPAFMDVGHSDLRIIIFDIEIRHNGIGYFLRFQFLNKTAEVHKM